MGRIAEDARGSDIGTPFRRHDRSTPSMITMNRSLESQLVYELDGQVQAFVYDDSTTMTGMYQDVKQNNDDDRSTRRRES
jgi:hypothetical protein